MDPGLMNAHAWYTLGTPLDWLRAGLWCAANLLTALAYFAIPWEIWHWRDELPFKSANVTSLLFVLFIVLCGESHMAMLLIMQTGPWWSVVLVYGPMAVVSVGTAVVMRRERNQIVQVLRSLTRVLRES